MMETVDRPGVFRGWGTAGGNAQAEPRGSGAVEVLCRMLLE